MFQPVKETFYLVSVGIQILIIDPLLEPVSFGWNHYLSSCLLNKSNQPITIIGFISYYSPGLFIFNQFCSHLQIMYLSACEHYASGIPQGIYTYMDFTAVATPATT